jgi:hypothetical protein
MIDFFDFESENSTTDEEEEKKILCWVLYLVW